MTRTTIGSVTIGATCALVFASALAACQPGEEPGAEYIEDMARGPGYKAFAPNRATRNGITLQRPVPGTIARGYHPFHYGKGDAEAERAGRELTNPFHPTKQETLDQGKLLYETYCQVCHGPEGKGDGPIASKIPPPTSYKSERVLGFLPGRIFHVITLGSGKMPSYAAQLSPEDRWLIITYVRKALQDLPEAEPGTPDPVPPMPPAPENPTGSEDAAAPATGAAPGATPAAPTPPANGTAPATAAPAATPPAPAAASTPPAPAAGSGGKP